MTSSGMVVPVGNRLRPVSPRQEEPSFHCEVIAGQKSPKRAALATQSQRDDDLCNLPDHFWDTAMAHLDGCSK
jgi:hypothetical protein